METSADNANRKVGRDNAADDNVTNDDERQEGETVARAEKGAKQVPLVAIDYKREITALFAISLLGKVLPPQLFYTGRTDQCHPTYVPSRVGRVALKVSLVDQ